MGDVIAVLIAFFGSLVSFFLGYREGRRTERDASLTYREAAGPIFRALNDADDKSMVVVVFTKDRDTWNASCEILKEVREEIDEGDPT